MVERGVIRNRKFAQQIRYFSGMRFGKITPTDIDGFMDFNNKLFVFVECKHGDSEMPYGQQLAFERLVDACQSVTRDSVGFVTRWDGGDDINFSATVVTKYRFRGEWHEPRDGLRLRGAVEKMRQRMYAPYNGSLRR